ncbi:MAG TPA: thiamine pyrophosphate-dependent enzyme [Solirubrobacteraceae bacterium]|nr:thiamine pyrophosphate-dependent enzyme [Solirubrobacteraceae bacterium]
MPEELPGKEALLEGPGLAGPELDGGEAVLAALRSLGIEHVFSSPGSEWAPVWEALARQRRDGIDGPAYHDLTHETLAVGMATGYYLASRRMAAVLLHAGPGLLQGAVGVHGALLSGAAMLVCSSESITYGEGGGPDPGSQWYRNLSVLGGPHTFAAPWVKWSSQAPSVDVIYETVRRACEMAQRAPAGPVYLNLALEALLAPWRAPQVRKPVAAPGARVSPAREIEAIAQRLAVAERPVILTESAGRDPEAFHALVGLAEQLAIPVVEPQSAVCANFPKDHPLHVGSNVAHAADADMVLLVACRAPWYPPSASPAPGAEFVVIDDVPQRPHVVYQVLHADHYLEGDVATTLSALAAQASGHIDSSLIERRRSRWSAVHAEQQAAIDADERKAQANTERITPILLAKVLREELGEQAVFVDETITHSRVLQRHLRWNEPDRWIYVQGGLGQGTAVALGVKVAWSQRPVVLAIGDGSFLYNPVIQALMASRALGLPVLIVVFNNRQYLSMKFNHLRFYPDGVAVTEGDFSGVDLSAQPPLSEFGRPFGMPGWEVSEPAELRGVIREAAAAVADGTTAIVNVVF